MADEAGTTHVESAGGGPPSDGGTPSPGAESVAPGPDGSGPLASPIGETPTPPAVSEPEEVWKERHGGLKTDYDKQNVENKSLREQVEAYEGRFGALQPETATAPPANPWLLPAQAQQQTAAEYGQVLTPPAQGVKNAMDEAILSGDSIAYENARRWGQRIGMIQEDSVAAQVVPQGMTPEQVQQMMQQGFQQQAERSGAISTTVESARGMFGPEFMSGEVEVQGIKMSREAALRNSVGQTGQTDAFNAMLNLDGNGVQAFLYQKAEEKVRYDDEQAANAGQIPSGATVFPERPKAPSKQRIDMERSGAIFKPPQDPSRQQ